MPLGAPIRPRTPRLRVAPRSPRRDAAPPPPASTGDLLLEATRAGDVTRVEQLLAEGVADADRHKALNAALEAEALECISALQRRTEDNPAQTALPPATSTARANDMLEACHGKVSHAHEHVKRLLKAGCSPDVCDGDFCALGAAVHSNQVRRPRRGRAHRASLACPSRSPPALVTRAARCAGEHRRPAPGR
jgi:hypothetical protein